MEEYKFEKDALYRYIPCGNPLPDFQQTYVIKLVISKEMLWNVIRNGY